MFRHRVYCIAAHIAHRDAAPLAITQIDAIRSGRCDRDQLHVARIRQLRFTQREFVADNDGGVAYAVNNLLSRRFSIFDPLMIEVGPAKVRVDRLAFEKDYAFHAELNLITRGRRADLFIAWMESVQGAVATGSQLIARIEFARM